MRSSFVSNSTAFGETVSDWKYEFGAATWLGTLDGLWAKMSTQILIFGTNKQKASITGQQSAVSPHGPKLKNSW